MFKNESAIHSNVQTQGGNTNETWLVKIRKVNTSLTAT